MEQTEKMIKFLNTLGALGKQINKFKAIYMEEQGLKGSDLSLLLTLDTHPQGLRPEELCSLIHADKALISRSLKNLKTNGLVIKDETTVYKARYYLTQKGKELTEYLEVEAAKVFETSHMAIDQKQWEAFYDFSTALTTQLEQQIEARKKHQLEQKNSQESFPAENQAS